MKTGSGNRLFLIPLLWLLGLPMSAVADVPAWDPFAGDLPTLLLRRSALISRSDGGPGSSMLIFDRPGTSPTPEFFIDDMPLGVGNRWCDDPSLVPQAGLRLQAVDGRGSLFGSTTPQVRFRTSEVDTNASQTDTQFYKGSHESALRRLSFQTLQAPLVVTFNFDEFLDKHAWDFGVPDDLRDFGIPYEDFLPVDGVYKGETAVRRMQVGLQRNVDEDRFVGFLYRRSRQHKTGLPVIDVKHQEIWWDQTGLTWRLPVANGRLDGQGYITSADLEYDRLRKQEVVRKGTRLHYQPDALDLQLDVRAEAWRLYDNGLGMGWAGEYGGEVRNGGQQVDMAVGGGLSLAGQALAPRAALSWHRHAGWRPAAGLKLIDLAHLPGLDLDLDLGGRAPRSDELLTAARVVSPQRTYLLLPDADLGWERTSSATLSLRRNLLGVGLRLAAAQTRIRDGINWRPLTDGGTTGRWTNQMEMDSRCYEVSATRRGRFHGRYTAETRWTYRDMNLLRGSRLGLPPERSASAHLLWEHAYFSGDGILELGYTLDYAAAMPDPWLPDDTFVLPAATFHHLLLGFRLVGVDLGLELRNLTNQSVQLSSGALSNGFERRWRLHWTFLH